MERADKIFCILCAVALVGVLVSQHRGRGAQLDVSVLPSPVGDTGPAYLLSALPSHRIGDDYAPPVSYQGPDWS